MARLYIFMLKVVIISYVCLSYLFKIPFFLAIWNVNRNWGGSKFTSTNETNNGRSRHAWFANYGRTIIDKIWKSIVFKKYIWIKQHDLSNDNSGQMNRYFHEHVQMKKWNFGHHMTLRIKFVFDLCILCPTGW